MDGTALLPRRILVRLTRAVSALIVLSVIVGCNFPGSDTGSSSLAQTQTALSVQATVMSQQALQAANAAVQSQQATQVALAAQATVLAQQAAQIAKLPPTLSPQEIAATQMSQPLQATQLALLATQNALAAQPPAPPTVAQPVPVQPAPPTEQAPAPAQPAPKSPAEFDAWRKTASILLYEDMAGAENAGNYSSFRYVKKTLDTMGQDYTDVGSALGRLKYYLTSAGPGGKGWDLVIIAAERKTVVSGEYFDYLNDALKLGSAVIAEVWHFDKVSSGTASTLLYKCGIRVQKNFTAGDPNEAAMYIVHPDNPILHEPNDNLRFSNVTAYWPFSTPFNTLDLGDFMQTTGTGDAVILVGQKPNERNSYGTLTTCMKGQLLLETFSDHQVGFEDMGRAWENFIINQLRWHYENYHQ